MHVLAFRHVPFEGLGHIQPALESCGVGVECVDLYREGDGSARSGASIQQPRPG